MSVDTVKRSKINRLSHLLSSCQPFMESVGYFFKSNLDGLRTIWQHWIATPFSDAGAGLSIVMVFLSGLILYRGKNKNLDKTFDFLYSLLQAVLAFLTLAVVGFASIAISVLAISGMALNIAYSLVRLIYSFYKYRKYPKDIPEFSSIRQSYKKAMSKYGAGLVISAIVLISFLVVSVFFPYVAAAVSLSIALATSVMLLSVGIYELYKFFYPSRQKKNEMYYSLPVTSDQNIILSSPSLQETAGHNPIFRASWKPSGFEYYYVNERLKLTGNCRQDRETLILVAYEKILQLEKQLHSAKGGVGEIFWSQEAKRLAKLDFFNKSLNFLLATLPPQDISYTNGLDELNEISAVSIVRLFKWHEGIHKQKKLKPENNYSFISFQDLDKINSKVYQSFLRERGETELFIQAMKSYFENLATVKMTETQTTISISR